MNVNKDFNERYELQVWKDGNRSGISLTDWWGIDNVIGFTGNCKDIAKLFRDMANWLEQVKTDG